jgi:flagellar hook assembly protein FlgD
MIKMGPNPFNNQLFINFNAEKETNLAILIYDINGKLVNTLYNSKASAGEHAIFWNGKNNAGIDMEAGIYIVQFNTSTGSPVLFKVVKR